MTRKRARIVWTRVAGYVTVGYLICAILPRLFSRLSVIAPLAAFYWSLPGALLGSAVYAAWTGFRGRRQSRLGIVIGGAVGVLVSGFAIARLPAGAQPFPGPRGDPGLGAAVYALLCDLSAIVFC